MKKINIVKQSIKAPLNIKNVAQGKVLIVRGDAHCTSVVNGKFYSVLTDPIYEALRKRGVSISVLAKPFSNMVGELCYDNAADITASYARAVLLNKFFDNYLVVFWKKLLKHVECGYVIAILPSKELCKAAYDMKIRVADLQHGVISDEHPNYGRFMCEKRQPFELPSEYLLWDENSKDVLSKWCFEKNIRATVIGNPSFIKFGNSLDVKETKKKKTILYTLQWGLERNEECANYRNFLWPSELENFVKSNKNFRWVFRLHPAQYKDEDDIFNLIKRVFGCEVFGDSILYHNSPLFEVLREVDFHITFNSSVTIEAAWLNIPTALLDKQLLKGGPLENYYNLEKKTGIAKVLDLEESIDFFSDSYVYSHHELCGYKSQLVCFSDFIDRISK